MRTKSLLAAAAITAAGLASSLAQSNVYSLNVVGYVNVTIKPGYNLIANQLNNSASPTHVISTMLTNISNLADGSTFVSWNPATQDFNQPANWVGTPPDGPAWYNADFSAFSSETAGRGKSFFIKNEGAVNATLTMVGEVPQGSSSVAVQGAGYSFLANHVPAAQDILTVGFPIADNSTLAYFDATTQDYTQPFNGIATPPDGPAFYNADFSATVAVTPAVAQGFLYNTPGAGATWTRNFTVQ